jgi:hypothetical protein
MNQREKILAALVGLSLLAVGGYFLWASASKAFTSRQREIDDLQAQISRKLLDLNAGAEARDRLNRYEQRSLPGKLSEARSQYQEWLIATTVEFFGENKVAVKPAGEGSRDEVYDRLSFSIAGEGNLEQFSRFLYRFYELDYLHRIQSLRVQPIRNSKNLKITCEVEALMVRGADPKRQLGDEPGDRLALASLENDYLPVILGRNLFGRRNNPPEFSTVRSPSAETNRSFSQTVTARDADPLDELTIRLVEGPPGLEVSAERRDAKPGDPVSAQVVWRPTRTGRYDVMLSVADDGYPRREDLLAFTIDVRDPPAPPPFTRRDPPPAPKFQHSRYTFLTSVQQVGDEGVVWFFVRTTKENIVCRVGEELKVGDYRALVKRIDIDGLAVELDVEDEVLVLVLGQNLLDATPKPALKVGAASPASDATKAEQPDRGTP